MTPRSLKRRPRSFKATLLDVARRYPTAPTLASAQEIERTAATFALAIRNSLSNPEFFETANLLAVSRSGNRRWAWRASLRRTGQGCSHAPEPRAGDRLAA